RRAPWRRSLVRRGEVVAVRDDRGRGNGPDVEDDRPGAREQGSRGATLRRRERRHRQDARARQPLVVQHRQASRQLRRVVRREPQAAWLRARHQCALEPGRPDVRPADSLNPRRVRGALYQAGLAAAVALVAWYFVSNTAANLESRRIASGFAFLAREAGFEIGETTFLAYSAADTYLRALAVGVLNTFRVAGIGVVAATLLGALLGLARLSPNWLLAKLAAGYVEVIRNIPLLVQLFFWYAIITENLPGPRDALQPLPGVFLSNRGIAFPTPWGTPELDGF